jgi:hypothetical protein
VRLQQYSVCNTYNLDQHVTSTQVAVSRKASSSSHEPREPPPHRRRDGSRRGLARQRSTMQSFGLGLAQQKVDVARCWSRPRRGKRPKISVRAHNIDRWRCGGRGIASITWKHVCAWVVRIIRVSLYRSHKGWLFRNLLTCHPSFAQRLKTRRLQCAEKLDR